MSIKHQSNAKMSGWCLIDLEPIVFVMRDVEKNTQWVSDRVVLIGLVPACVFFRHVNDSCMYYVTSNRLQEFSAYADKLKNKIVEIEAGLTGLWCRWI